MGIAQTPTGRPDSDVLSSINRACCITDPAPSGDVGIQVESIESRLIKITMVVAQNCNLKGHQRYTLYRKFKDLNDTYTCGLDIEVGALRVASVIVILRDTVQPK